MQQKNQASIMKLGQQTAIKGKKKDTRFIKVRVNFSYVLTDHVDLYSLIKNIVEYKNCKISILNSYHNCRKMYFVCVMK